MYRYDGHTDGGIDCRTATFPSYTSAPDMDRCPVSAKAPSTRAANCGCPSEDETDCYQCCMPGVVETRILRKPQRCELPDCHYSIPAMTCWDPPTQPRNECNPLCFDWRVDEPGPNDSYGLNGLNWYDYRIFEGRYKDNRLSKDQIYTPAHPGFTNVVPKKDALADFVCKRPMECYSKEPNMISCNYCPFAKDVNYFRDWRCCEAKPPAPWKPPRA